MPCQQFCLLHMQTHNYWGHIKPLLILLPLCYFPAQGFRNYTNTLWNSILNKTLLLTCHYTRDSTGFFPPPSQLKASLPSTRLSTNLTSNPGALCFQHEHHSKTALIIRNSSAKARSLSGFDNTELHYNVQEKHTVISWGRSIFSFSIFLWPVTLISHARPTKAQEVTRPWIFCFNYFMTWNQVCIVQP